jgi:hypothetical protein
MVAILEVWGCGVCFWCDTPLLRTGIFAVDLCGNRSGGAEPRSTALGGDGKHAHNVVVTPV